MPDRAVIEYVAAAVKSGSVDVLPVVFDAQGVFADEVVREFFHCGPGAFGLALKGGLAPSDDAGIGGYFDQAHPPAGIELFDFCDFHGRFSEWWIGRIRVDNG